MDTVPGGCTRRSDGVYQDANGNPITPPASMVPTQVEEKPVEKVQSPELAEDAAQTPEPDKEKPVKKGHK